MGTVLLTLGGARQVLAGYLWQLSRRTEVTAVLALMLQGEPGSGPERRAEVQRTFHHFCQQNGRYDDPAAAPALDFLELASFEGEAHAARFREATGLLVTPEEAVLNGEDPGLFDMALSEGQSELLTALEGAGLAMDQGALLAALQAKGPELLPLEEAFALVRACAQEWLDLEGPRAEAAWSEPLGARTRALLAMQLWRTRLLAHHRDLVREAILRLHTDPGHSGARLALLLHKRTYRHAGMPPWLANLEARCRGEHGRHLELLPPVQDFTVTILVITYNRLELLQRAVGQIIAQHYPHWRLVLCDHGSTDGTAAYCRELERAHPGKVRVIRKAVNAGVEAVGSLYQEMMRGVETELVLHHSDDDWLFPQHLQRTVDYFKAHPWAGMVTGAYAGVSPEMKLEFQYGPFYGESQMADPQVELQRALHAGVCPQGCVHRRELLREIAEEDVLVEERGEVFAHWDYFVATKLLGQVEVGYVNDVLTGITVSPHTAFAGQDFAYPFLRLMEGLWADYNALFGAGTYPFDLAQRFAQAIVLPMITKHFVQALASAPSKAGLETALEAKRRSWEQFVHISQRIPRETSRLAPPLVG